VGCAFSDKIVLPETFAGNPDINDAVYSTEYGVYKPHCGLDNVMLSWGHDEVRVSASRFLPFSSSPLSSHIL
jgi:inositol oxygenase